MDKKIKVALLYGGASPEHEVSLMTADSIRKNIDRSLFGVTDFFIDKNGNFDEANITKYDIAFLAVHGPNCEDGKLQKTLEELGVPYTGAGVKASRLNMDKVLMHQAFIDSNIPTVKFLSVSDIQTDFTKITSDLDFPCFVKPSNGGSSIGISKVESEKELSGAINLARKYDRAVIIEGAIDSPREIEIAILGNNELTISEPGEILSNGEFYSYETKYLKPFDTTTLPQNLGQDNIVKIKMYAEKAYRATGCEGYARIDFFVDKKGKLFLNEINTLPGFTKISMFPTLMKNIGISYTDLITKIIMLGLEKK